jgi:hypothetical protein
MGSDFFCFCFLMLPVPGGISSFFIKKNPPFFKSHAVARFLYFKHPRRDNFSFKKTQKILFLVQSQTLLILQNEKTRPVMEPIHDEMPAMQARPHVQQQQSLEP